jgi:hypothetical protein
LQIVAGAALACNVSSGGSVIVIVIVDAHPFASVTVIWYAPAAILLALAEDETLGDQVYEYGPTPPACVTLITPVDCPKQATLVTGPEDATTVRGSVIVNDCVIEQPLTSVIVQV